MIYYLPIEPLHERYTEQWYRWFPAEFERQGLEYHVVDGEPLVDTVQVGTFLDINSTLHYKSEQLKRVAKLFHQRKVKDGDVFLVADVEFWGIESIRYLATLNRLKVRLLGFAHAGSYTYGDFVAPCAPFAKHYETAWGATFDLLFVGSAYHKQRLVTQRQLPQERIVVTGNPYDLDEAKALVGDVRKRQRVILTNRPDPEKAPHQSLDVIERLKQQHPSWEFMVTTGRDRWGSGDVRKLAVLMEQAGVLKIREGISKQQYLTYLAESQVMISNTLEENFGYCVLEALALDTIPVVPADFSHPELVEEDKRCLYTSGNLHEQVLTVEAAMQCPFPVARYAEKYRGSLAAIVKHCGEAR